jgi:hypothetical protein
MYSYPVVPACVGETATAQVARAAGAPALARGGGDLTARSLHCLGAVAVGNERRPKQTHSQTHTPLAHNKNREREEAVEREAGEETQKLTSPAACRYLNRLPPPPGSHRAPGRRS